MIEYGGNTFGIDGYRPLIVPVAGLVFALDRSSVAGDTPGPLRAFDASTGVRRALAGDQRATWIASNGHWAAVTRRDPDDIAIVSLPSLEVLHETPLAGAPTRVVLSDDLAAATLEDRVVGVEVSSGALRWQVPIVPRPSVVVFAPDGRRVAVGTGGTRANPVFVIDAVTGVAAKVSGPRADVSDMCWSPDGTALFVAAGPALLRWSGGGKAESVARWAEWIRLLGFVPEGPLLVYGGGHRLRAYNADGSGPAWEGEHLRPWRVGCEVFVDSLESRGWDVLDGRSGRRLRSLEVAETSLCGVTADEGRVWGALGNRLVAWDPQTGRRVTPEDGHDDEVTNVHVQGARAASVGRDRRACVWDVESGRMLGRFGGGGLGEARAVFLDGDTLLTGFGRCVQRWRLADGALLAESECLKDDICLVHPAGDLVIACAEAQRGSYGEIALLDAATLEKRRGARTVCSWERLWRRGDSLLLVGTLVWAELDMATAEVREQNVLSSSDFSRSYCLSDDLLRLVEYKRVTDESRETSKLWIRDLATGEQLVDGREIAPAEVVGFAGNRDLVVAHTDGTLAVYDGTTAGRLRSLEIPFQAEFLVVEGEQAWIGNAAGRLVRIALP